MTVSAATPEAICGRFIVRPAVPRARAARHKRHVDGLVVPWLTVIVKFNPDKTVKDYAVRASQF